MKKCDKGWHDGSCCCNCAHQIKLCCHPWNGRNLEYGWLEDKIKFGQGPITKQCGWVCDVFTNPSLIGEEEPSMTFFDREHGMCELHTPKQK